MLLGNKIRSLRDEKGILQGQVAEYLEIAFFLNTKKAHNRIVSFSVVCFNYILT